MGGSSTTLWGDDQQCRNDVMGDVMGDCRNDVMGDVMGDCRNDVMSDVMGDCRNDVMSDVMGDCRNDVMGDCWSDVMGIGEWQYVLDFEMQEQYVISVSKWLVHVF